MGGGAFAPPCPLRIGLFFFPECDDCPPSRSANLHLSSTVSF